MQHGDVAALWPTQDELALPAVVRGLVHPQQLTGGECRLHAWAVDAKVLKYDTDAEVQGSDQRHCLDDFRGELLTACIARGAKLEGSSLVHLGARLYRRRAAHPKGLAAC